MQTSIRPSALKKLRLATVSALTALAVFATLLVPFAAPAGADGPISLHRTYRGEIGDGQPISALSTMDQSGTQDTWSNYLEFSPDALRHASLFRANVGAAEPGQTATVDLNFRGPNRGYQVWAMFLRDYTTKKWVRVWRNPKTREWKWTAASVEIADADRFVDRRGRMLVRWVSNNNKDVGQLDYLNIALDPVDPVDPSGPKPLPANVAFDYQIGGDYTPRAGVGVVARDWFAGSALDGAYNICYVNAFQTQDDDPWVDRPDERNRWPQSLVLMDIGDDPNWGGEYLINIDTATQRTQAANWVTQMVQGCADKGFDAVEYDNLDSWTRFDGTPLEGQIPFSRSDTLAYAELLADIAHDRGLAVAQKNTADLTRAEAIDRIGFDFAVVESCGQWNECDVFTGLYGDQVVAIEYSTTAFNAACAAIGDTVSVVLRDLYVRTPNQSGYRYGQC